MTTVAAEHVLTRMLPGNILNTWLLLTLLPLRNARATKHFGSHTWQLREPTNRSPVLVCILLQAAGCCNRMLAAEAQMARYSQHASPPGAGLAGVPGWHAITLTEDAKPFLARALP